METNYLNCYLKREVLIKFGGSNYKWRLVFEEYQLYSAFLPISVSAQTSGHIFGQSNAVFWPKKEAIREKERIFKDIKFYWNICKNLA